MSDVTAKLSAHYQRLEEGLAVAEDSEYASLVVPNGNHAQSVHRWFHFKEGYSCWLFDRLDRDLDLASNDSLTVLDPFLGSGTTLVSAIDWARSHPEIVLHGVGLERNPFLHLLAQCKVEAAREENFDTAQLEPILRCAYARPGRQTVVPDLSTFSEKDFFESSQIRALIAIRDSLLALPDDFSRRLGLLALAASVEPVSRLRRDGRTLRYAPTKPWVAPANEFRRRLRLISEDLKAKRAPLNPDSSFSVHLSDGRQSAKTLNSDLAADLIVFSPPYPNNIDYTEVYKLEAWILGYYSSAEEFREQRTQTLRSHPSIRFGETQRLDDKEIEEAIDSLIRPVENAIPDDRYRTGRQAMFRGYLEDLALTLAEARNLCNVSSHCVIVVGNSLHGSELLIAADLLIASVAPYLGWKVESLTVARRPVRRSAAEPRLRETVITLSAI
jgi:hypothetical protein